MDDHGLYVTIGRISATKLCRDDVIHDPVTGRLFRLLQSLDDGGAWVGWVGKFLDRNEPGTVVIRKTSHFEVSG